jgi:hypothetical protein
MAEYTAAEDRKIAYRVAVSLDTNQLRSAVI